MQYAILAFTYLGWNDLDNFHQGMNKRQNPFYPNIRYGLGLGFVHMSSVFLLTYKIMVWLLYTLFCYTIFMPYV